MNSFIMKKEMNLKPGIAQLKYSKILLAENCPDSIELNKLFDRLQSSLLLTLNNFIC